jgi:hypothetical protein
MPTYKAYPDDLKLFVSDRTNISAQAQIGFDPQNKSNVAYTAYGLNYALFRWLGGFNVRLPSSLTVQVGGVFTVWIDNLTTGNPANSFTQTITFDASNMGSNVVQIMVGMQDQVALAPGFLDIYGTYTDSVTRIIYVFNSTNITQVLP